MHLHDQFWQIEPGQARVDRRTQCDQAWWLFDLFQAFEGEVRTCLSVDDRDGRVHRDTIGSFSIGKIEPARQTPKLFISDGGHPDGAADCGAGRLPCRT